jgi:propionyl-CoA synthetase
LAGERLDTETYHWANDGLHCPVVDNWWQTETGWPIAANPRGLEQLPVKPGSPSVPVPGYNISVVDSKGAPVKNGKDGNIVISLPMPPGTLAGLWGRPDGYEKAYLNVFDGFYATGDSGRIDEDGYVYVMGRTDDVINVAGHRLGTREIEECISSHPNVAEVAVVGIADQLKGQVAVAFAVAKDASGLGDPAAKLRLEGEVMRVVEQSIGAVGRPARVYFVNLLPKTRSGKLLRRAIQAVCEGRDPGDLTTMDDPSALQQIKDLVAPV